MNAVENYIRITGERADLVVSELMARGKISDNCITAADVSDADGKFIWAWLFPPREFALLKGNGWIMDPYRPEHQSFPQPWREQRQTK